MPKNYKPRSTLWIDVGPEAAERFRRAAGARDMTQAKFLLALMDLHDAIRTRAAIGGRAFSTRELRGVLGALGLETVEV